jgi:hypothetical protein
MSSPFRGDITWLKAQHITHGCSGGGFHPTATLRRQAVAAFIHGLENPGNA